MRGDRPHLNTVTGTSINTVGMPTGFTVCLYQCHYWYAGTGKSNCNANAVILTSACCKFCLHNGLECRQAAAGGQQPGATGESGRVLHRRKRLWQDNVIHSLPLLTP